MLEGYIKYMTGCRIKVPKLIHLETLISSLKVFSFILLQYPVLMHSFETVVTSAILSISMAN